MFSSFVAVTSVAPGRSIYFLTSEYSPPRAEGSSLVALFITSASVIMSQVSVPTSISAELSKVMPSGNTALTQTASPREFVATESVLGGEVCWNRPCICVRIRLAERFHALKYTDT